MSYTKLVRLIARSTLLAYARSHPETAAALSRWAEVIRAGEWSSMSEVQASFSKARVLNGERVRFEIAGGDYRLIAAFDFVRKVVFVKFVGSHAEYDRVDALTVSQF